MAQRSAASYLLGAVAAFLAIGIVLLAHASWVLFVALCAFGSLVALGFALIRHTRLQNRRESRTAILQNITNQAALDSPSLSYAYFLIVLGSGGHTKEMLAMMEINFPKLPSIHRRYVVSSGDTMSIKHLTAFEDTIRTKYGEDKAGTYDAHIVTRARKIHQSLLTTPFSAIQSLLEIFPLLLKSPFNGPRRRQQHPDIILTNGPATGFIVALVAYLLKIFCVVPEEAMQVLFIESWARIKSLSLTGKLFHYSQIADTVLVQHEKVAQQYGLVNAGCMVVNRGGR